MITNSLLAFPGAGQHEGQVSHMCPTGNFPQPLRSSVAWSRNDLWPQMAPVLLVPGSSSSSAMPGLSTVNSAKLTYCCNKTYCFVNPNIIKTLVVWNMVKIIRCWCIFNWMIILIFYFAFAWIVDSSLRGWLESHSFPSSFYFLVVSST